MLFFPVPPILFVVNVPVFGSTVVLPPITFLTLSATLYNCPPFTASFEPTATRPSVTPVILPVAASSLMLPD